MMFNLVASGHLEMDELSELRQLCGLEDTEKKADPSDVGNGQLQWIYISNTYR